MKGSVRLPDVSLEMLDDLEVDFGDASAQLAGTSAVDVLQSAVKEWAAAMRKVVSDNLASLPLDPPSRAVKPRAAALISDEEAMSAGGSARLEDDDIEELPHPDDVAGAVGEEEEGEGEEEPFTEEEVAELYGQAQEMLKEAVETEQEYNEQMTDLDKELEGKDLQDRGRILYDVIEYLEQGEEEGEEGDEGQPTGAEGDEGEEGAEDDEIPPYPGKKGLEDLWAEVLELCAEEDVPRLENELKGKSDEQQWATLCEVKTFLLEGDEEEQQAFMEWQPTPAELDAEWKALMQRVPPEEAKEVEGDYRKASAEDKKRMVWDVRKFLDEQEGEEEEAAGQPQPAAGGANNGSQAKPRNAPPPRPPTDAELGGPSEMRRRGGASRGASTSVNSSLGWMARPPPGAGKEWDEFYAKEMRSRNKGGRRPMALYLVLALALIASIILLGASALAEEGEGALASALRLTGLSGGAVPHHSASTALEDEAAEIGVAAQPATAEEYE